MAFVLVLIGVVILVTALKNTQGNLATALESDVPGFAKWFLAIGAVGGLGYIPGMQQISRWLLALVLVVLVLKNYQAILTGLENAAGSTSGATTAGATTPAQSFAANPTSTPTAAQISGTTGTATASTTSTAGTSTGAGSTTASVLDPTGFMTAWAQQAASNAPMLAADLASMGFGGIA